MKILLKRGNRSVCVPDIFKINKYPDCAVAGNADLLVSNDSDFRVLTQTKFPNITLLTAEEFLEFLSNLHD